ncbi:MAG: hypothetical protein J7J61_04340 [Candidatus Hydrothermae bacterium]|nr:hypothetical protein [Candidatus Hydrothermae bacterium]
MHEVYEYKCPVCGHINRRDVRTGRVVCDKCGESFYPDKLQNLEDVMFLLRKILEAIDSLKASMPVYPYIPLPYQLDYPWPQITYDSTPDSFPQYEVSKTTG